MNRHDTRRQCIAEVMAREGGYVNHPDDRGGPTNYGVTQAVARDHGYQGDMQDYPEASAFAVYDKQYWQRLKLDLVAELSPELAIQLFDFGVNSGTSRAAKAFQGLLNTLNNRGKYYRDIDVDGGIGPMTMTALEGFYRSRGDYGLDVLTKSLNGLRVAFCVAIAEGNESQETFVYGWLSRVVNL